MSDLGQSGDSRPRLLDLFCGAGGASRGYQLAGFYVVGVDVALMPRYAGDEFLQADAMDCSLEGFDAIHASPPCQMYSRALRHLSDPQPMLIDAVRGRLIDAGVPWVIENVEGSPLARQDTFDGRYGVELCGTSFGLPVWRHRLFECSFPLPQRPACDHRAPAMNPHNQVGRDRLYAEFGKQNPNPLWNEAMGVGWMNRDEGRKAIPPAMTHWIGRYLMAQVRQRAKVAA